MVGLLVSMDIGNHGEGVPYISPEVLQTARVRASKIALDVGLIINQGRRRGFARKGIDESARQVYILVGVKQPSVADG
jgi:hypothetical protein